MDEVARSEIVVAGGIVKVTTGASLENLLCVTDIRAGAVTKKHRMVLKDTDLKLRFIVLYFTGYTRALKTITGPKYYPIMNCARVGYRFFLLCMQFGLFPGK